MLANALRWIAYSFFTFLFAASFPTQAISKSSWQSQALLLTGTSETVRNQAIAQLRSERHLVTQLRRSLNGKDRFLALDVIAELRLKEVLDDLLESAKSDRGGFTYNAINRLLPWLDAEHRRNVTAVFLERIFDLKVPWGSKVALLDSLARLEVPIEPGSLKLLLQDPNPEVGSAALNYIRYSLLRWRNAELLPLLEVPGRQAGLGLRRQAELLVSELDPVLRQRASRYLQPSQQDVPSSKPRRRNLKDLLHRYLSQAKLILGEMSQKKFPTTQTQCTQFYDQLYARGDLDIRIFFGYKDARPARYVGDRYEKAYLIQRITDPCTSERQDCGFVRQSEGLWSSHLDEDRLEKVIMGSDGHLKTIQLQVMDSSASSDDLDNRTNPFQLWKSERVQKSFLTALKEADIVFYDGHSRRSGGPDFQPPRISENGHVRYGWYDQNQPGMKLILSELNERVASPLRLMGFFSCASSRWLEDLEDLELPLGKKVGFITSSRLIYFSDAMESMLGALSGVLGMQCQPDFNKLMSSQENQAGTVIEGFFD